MQLLVPGLGTPTTYLGYGSSQLMGRLGARPSLALLETAFDSGIRHFDTAPSYGFGAAERVLGQALSGKRDKVTITTKFGLSPPQNRTLVAAARRAAVPLVALVPGLKRRLVRAAGGLVRRARFAPDELRLSLEHSLAALRTDYIDILLLHEATASDLGDELFAALERSVKDGKIRTFGIGSAAAAAAAIQRADRRFCPVLQFEWSVLSGPKPDFPGSFVITHRALAEDFQLLRAWLGANPKVARRWSDELGADVADASALSGLMLAAARDANRGGITLFSSRNADHIRRNVALLGDEARLAAGAAFARLVARDAPASLVRDEKQRELVDAGRP
jgi:D-threo-aldose 1-dehydrogenase